jgi:hypothetical protein
MRLNRNADGAVRGQVAAELVELVAHVRDRTRGIVGGRFDQNGDAVRSVSFI